MRRPPISTLFPYTTLFRSQRAVPLDQLEEHGGPVTGGPGEDLQEVAVLVAVDEDAALLELLDGDPHRADRSEEHTSELQSRQYLVCRLLLEKKKNPIHIYI